MEETTNSLQETSGSTDSVMETDEPNLTMTLQFGTDPLIHDIQTGERLSPNTQKHLYNMLQSIRSGNARCVRDEKGRSTIEYKEKRKLYWDASNANRIAKPRTDDVKLKMESCLELIDYLKAHKPPSGVVLPEALVQLNKGMYREGYDFEKTKEVLGSGTMAGDIVVIKDKKTGMEFAQKTIMISVFRKDEIRAWIDVAETGYAPALYSFYLQGNEVVVVMEKVSKAITLRKIIDECMSRMDASHVKPFSLYVLDGLLEATRALHVKRWAHGDLHPGNLMMQKHPEAILKVRILDFGLAQPFDGSQGLDFKNFQKDMRNVVRLFSALYCGEEFEDDYDLQWNWQTKLGQIPLPDKDRKELICLIDSAMKIVHPQDVPEFHELVQETLQSALPDAQSHDDMMKKVIAILFPDVRDFRAIHADLKEDILPESHPLDVADSVVRKPPHFSSVKHQDVADSVVRKPPHFSSVKHQDVADSVVRKPPHFSNVKHQDVADSRVPASSGKTDPVIPDEILEQFRLSLAIRMA